MAAVGHAATERLVSGRHHDGDLEIGTQRVGQREHALEMTETHATAAVRGQERTRGHDLDARAAAHACIRCSAITTSS